MKLFKSLLVAPATLGLLAPMSATANEINLADLSGYSSSEEIQSVSDFNAAKEIAGRSRGTPRICNALLRRVRDFAQIKGDGNIDIEITKYALKSLNVDKFGLDEMDNKILTTLIKKFNGQPVGLNTLSTAVSETAETIEEVYEPFLIQEGFLLRTPRGRQVTKKAYNHLDIQISNSQKDLFD